jgi:hypothetical protein
MGPTTSRASRREILGRIKVAEEGRPSSASAPQISDIEELVAL